MSHLICESSDIEFVHNHFFMSESKINDINECNKISFIDLSQWSEHFVEE
jgi:hypothetical protein